MATPDPVQAIRDAITELEARLAPVEDEVRQVRAEADARVAEIEQRGADDRRELERWRQALAHAEGTAPPTPARRAGSRWHLDENRLVAALRASGPQNASDIRRSLDLTDDVTSAALTRALGDATSRGVVTRTGERRATRYSAPE